MFIRISSDSRCSEEQEATYLCFSLHRMNESFLSIIQFLCHMSMTGTSLRFASCQAKGSEREESSYLPLTSLSSVWDTRWKGRHVRKNMNVYQVRGRSTRVSSFILLSKNFSCVMISMKPKSLLREERLPQEKKILWTLVMQLSRQQCNRTRNFIALPFSWAIIYSRSGSDFRETLANYRMKDRQEWGIRMMKSTEEGY
jgi:hypothetical protein